MGIVSKDLHSFLFTANHQKEFGTIFGNRKAFGKRNCFLLHQFQIRHPVDTKVADRTVLFGKTYQVIIIAVPCKAVRTDCVHMSTVLQLFCFIRQIPEILKRKLSALVDGLMDCINDVIDLPMLPSSAISADTVVRCASIPFFAR